MRRKTRLGLPLWLIVVAGPALVIAGQWLSHGWRAGLVWIAIYTGFAAVAVPIDQRKRIRGWLNRSGGAADARGERPS